MREKSSEQSQWLLSRKISGSSFADDDLDELEHGQNQDTKIFTAHDDPWWRRHQCLLLAIRSISRRKWSAAALVRPCRRSLIGWLVLLIWFVPYALVVTLVVTAIFFPSYSHPPQRYDDLKNRASSGAGSVNPRNEKVFIAASLYDPRGDLVSGQWGRSVLGLVDLLGPENVFLSIYEDDPDEIAKSALEGIATRVKCESELKTEHLDPAGLAHVATPEGQRRLKRVEFLAEVRNRALRPLQNSSSPAYYTRFDKLLFLNDVLFDPVDAANLLLSTNLDEGSGRTQYRAACAMDFADPFKYYDTFATRDLEGYALGVPVFPWFSTSGKGESRRDVLAQKDAVRVKSCWGGMVAFEAKWFQLPTAESEVDADGSSAEDTYESMVMTDIAKRNNPNHPVLHGDQLHNSEIMTNLDKRSADGNASLSLRFRAEADTYWESSECCLIHADLAAMEHTSLPVGETGIYMNPYIRVAYSRWAYHGIPLAKRLERLLPLIHRIISWIGHVPSFNPRRAQAPGDQVLQRVWVGERNGTNDSRVECEASSSSAEECAGRFELLSRTALPGGFCGMRRLMYINEHPSDDEPRWADDPVPGGGIL